MSGEPPLGERVQQLREHIKDGKHPDSFIPKSELDTGHNIMSVAECLRVRERYDDPDTSLQNIADSTEWGLNTVWRHVNNKCNHQKVTKRQCNAIRCAAQDGMYSSEIAELFDIVDSRRTAHHHATGDCNHDDDVEAVETTYQITAADCQRMREWYAGSDIRQQDIADAMGYQRGTINPHLNGRCSHDHE